MEMMSETHTWRKRIIILFGFGNMHERISFFLNGVYLRGGTLCFCVELISSRLQWNSWFCYLILKFPFNSPLSVELMFRQSYETIQRQKERQIALSTICKYLSYVRSLPSALPALSYLVFPTILWNWDYNPHSINRETDRVGGFQKSHSSEWWS